MNREKEKGKGKGKGKKESGRGGEGNQSCTDVDAIPEITHLTFLVFKYK